MNIKIKIIYIVLVLFLLVIPVFKVGAMTIVVNPPQEPMQIGKTSLINITLSNRDQSKEINALEGIVKISAPHNVVAITTGGSIFNLWPTKPSLKNNEISFTGGTQSGVFGSALKIFTIAVKPQTSKDIRIDFQNVNAYLNDGLGTKVVVSGLPLNIPVSEAVSEEDELDDLISLDTQPPQSFEIDLGRDPSLYEGKYFISFYAIDNESGIKKYEVKETGYPLVRSGSIYILQNQSLSGEMEVRAIDNAGNQRIKTVSLQDSVPWTKVILAIIILYLIGILVRKIFKITRKIDV